MIILSILYFCILVYISSYYNNFEERLQDESYMKTVIINFIVSVCMFTSVFYFTNLPVGIPLLKNIIITLLVTDTLYYWFHYTSHRIPFIKQYMHSTHHTLSNLVPLDSFFLDSFDHSIYGFLVLYLPLLFVENIVEYFILLFISMLHSIYLHSDISEEFILPMFINAKYHALHHSIGQGNYSIFFSFWDDYMRTRVNEVNEVSKSIKSMTLDEFKKECSKGEMLTIIDDEVIDCKSWIDLHPGGKSLIKNLIGKISTDDFHKFHGDSKVAKEMLKKLKIADLSK